ncbi:MAG: helix-turn-helix domain-containing protein [Liquorilactobacillus sp.]
MNNLFSQDFENQLIGYFKSLANTAFTEVCTEHSNQSEYLTKAEAAKLLKCSEKTVKKLVDEYALPEIKADHFIRYKKSDVENLMEQLKC